MQPVDHPRSCLVVRNPSPGFLQNFCNHDLIRKRRELSAESGKKVAQHGFDAVVERLPRLIQEAQFTQVSHTTPLEPATTGSASTLARGQYTTVLNVSSPPL
jgi:hypothetical protein